MVSDKRLSLALFLLRISVFVVMLMWILDKFIRPDHAAQVFANFYLLSDLSHNIIFALGGIELLIILGFLLGIKKTFTYGVVFILHAISTFSSYSQYLDPFSGVNLLFFAAWPMLAACLALFILRKYDTIATWQK